MSGIQAQQLPPKTRPLLAGGIVLVLMWILQLAIVLGPGFSGPATYDERTYHIPAIRMFAEQLPSPDLSSYPVASTPGYHLFLAVAVEFGADSDTAIRLLGGQFAVLLAALTSCWIGRRIEWPYAVVLSLPAWISVYTLAPMVIALPEAAAWLGVMAMLVIGLRRRVTRRWMVIAGVVFVGLISVRQIHIWAAVPIWLSAWLGSERPEVSGRLLPGLEGLELGDRVPRAVFAFACTLPGFLVLVWFFWMWQGPVPPLFQDAEAAAQFKGATVHSGGNPATAAMVLAFFGVLAPFFVVSLLPLILRRLTEHPWIPWYLISAGVLGFLISVLPETSYDQADGRWTGLWNLAQRLPTIGERSPAIILIATGGGVMLAMMLLLVRFRDRLILAGSIAAFVVAQSANHQAWARYIVPLVLFMLVFMSCLALQRAPRRRLTHLIGPAILAVICALDTSRRIFGS